MTQIGSSEDWESTKAKAMEQSKSLIDFNDLKPQTNKEQTMDIDEVAFSKLQIRQSDPKEELLEVMKSLIPLPSMTEASEYMTGKHQWRRAVRSGEKASEGRRTV